MNRQQLQEKENKLLLDIKCVRQMRARAKTAEAREKLDEREKLLRQQRHDNTIQMQRLDKQEREAEKKAFQQTKEGREQAYRKAFAVVAHERLSQREYRAIRDEASSRAEGRKPEPLPAWVRWRKRAANAVAVVLAGLVLTGCEVKGGPKVDVGNGFEVQKLFTHDGCTVYRFFDGYDRYFTRCDGAASSSASWSNGGKTKSHQIAETSYTREVPHE